MPSPYEPEGPQGLGYPKLSDRASHVNRGAPVREAMGEASAPALDGRQDSCESAWTRRSVQFDAVEGFATEEQVGARAELNRACGVSLDS
jgi:hypothetical protein